MTQTDILDRKRIVQRLLELPIEIEEVEYEVVELSIDVEVAKDMLRDKEATLYNEGKVEGKNEAQRKACLTALTATERVDVSENEKALARARVGYNRKMNDFSAMKAVARLLAGEVV